MKPEKENEVFERIFDETREQVRAYIAGLGVPLLEVDDVAQDVYVEFYKTMSAMPKDTMPVRWLKGIARNLCMKYFQKTKLGRERQYEVIAALLADSADASGGAAREFCAATEILRKCVEKLSGRNRQLVALKYDEDKTSEEIGAALDTNVATVRVSLMRIRGDLRECVNSGLRSGEPA